MPPRRPLREFLRGFALRVDVSGGWARGAFALEEVAILWLVFANLERFLEGRFTLVWGLGNTIIPLFVWTLGVYIQARRKIEVMKA